MPAQKILGLDSRQAQHFGDLVERQGVLAVTLERECLQREARHVTTSDCKTFSHIIRNAKDHFHVPSLA